MIILQIRLKAVFVFWFSIKSEAKVVILLTKKSSSFLYLAAILINTADNTQKPKN